ncbi:hypothetical protein CCYA_CCYA05G1651 [Cyanidiococcus yangmingshanensis]|nr:hypothetical protein CCYA_CCYA05G1651 [Cyanidiococcus yangmingshanensis]
MTGETFNQVHLSAHDRETLQRKGFLVLRGFLEPTQLQALSEDALFAQLYATENLFPSLLAQHGGVLTCYDRTPTGIVSAEEYLTKIRWSTSADSESAASVCRAVVSLAQAALSCCFDQAPQPSIFLYNEQFICKPPTRSIYSAFDIHRDRDYDAIDKYCRRPGTVALWGPLSGPVSRLNGALCMVPRSEESHFSAFLANYGVSMDMPSAFTSAALCDALMTSAEAPLQASHAELLAMDPGDIVVFADDVWHWSVPNRGKRCSIHATGRRVPFMLDCQMRVAWMAQFSADVVHSKRRGGAPAALAVYLPVAA